MYWLCLWKEQMESFNHWNSNVVMVTTLRLTTSALIVIIETRGSVGSPGWSPWLSFSFLKQWQYQWQFMTVFFHALFYTPAWKTDVLCRGNVRPSVNPGFPDFSSTCFEISIWNLVYTFSRWHNMPSLSCIAIGSLWPSLQPKVSQTHFLQSWPH